MVDADTILAEASPKKRGTEFGHWLDADPTRRDLYRELLTRGYRDGGIPHANVLRAFLKHFPDAPKVNEQTEKRKADEYLDSLAG